MTQHVFSRKSILTLLITILFILTLASVSATIVPGNVTLDDIDSNTSATYNFTNQSATSGAGYVRYNSSDSGFFVEALNGAKLLNLDMFSSDTTGQTFRDELLRVPNSTFTDLISNDCYGCKTSTRVFQGFAVGLFLPDSTHAVIFIKNISGSNINFEYKLNDNASNNTFQQPLTGCAAHITLDQCFDDTDNECEWEVGICDSHGGFDDHDFSDCEMLPRNGCIGINTSTCLWDWSQGTSGLCIRQTNFNENYGYNCTGIINETFCDNQDFTEGTGLCSWDSGTSKCLVNTTKTVTDLPEPPVFACDAPGYVTNETKCTNLSNSYFMSCGWNNQTSRCEDLFFNFARFDDFDDITTQDTCQTVGGTWKTETTFDPISNKLLSENWCEFGIAVRDFSDVGSGGTFQGNAGQLSDCSRDCFACEFNNSASPPAQWSSSAIAQTQCEASVVGCSFRADTNAFNGQGWCDPLASTGGFNCDLYCGDCNLLNTAQTSCTGSAAGCKWDNNSNSCINKGSKSCQQECFQCPDEASCGFSLASGGCDWDSETYICTPKGGRFEICFDGIDNDNNGKTDCTDFKCNSDPFCGGSSVDSVNCFQYDLFGYGSGAEGNCTGATGCTWITDDFSFSYCAPLSEQCWQNESFFTDQTGCENYGGGDVCTFVQGGTCHENATLFSLCNAETAANDCNAVSGCKWNAAASFCDIESIIVCDDNGTLQHNETACSNAGCIWQGDTFGHDFEGGGFAENCISPCISAGITTQAGCTNAMNGTPFQNGTCEWFTGQCEPKDFIGGCIEDDGDYSACTASSKCIWTADPLGGPLRNPNRSSTNLIQTNEAWMAIGLEYPQGGSNESVYILNTTTSSFLRIEMIADNASTLSPNVTRIYCGAGGAMTLMLRYNWSNQSIQDGAGVVDAYANGTCAPGDGTARTYHYFLNTSGRALEVLWQVPILNLSGLDAIVRNQNVSDVTNISTVIIDGNLDDQIPENSSSDDNITNATRVRTSYGFCHDTFQNSFFLDLDQEEPLPIAGDVSGDVLDATFENHNYLDLLGLGLKKTSNAYMYGMPTASLAGSVMCKGISVQSGALGGATNASKYYLYLDTDGTTTGGCAAQDNTSLTGFEYLFKYTNSFDTTTGKIKETLLSQQCTSSAWVPSGVPFKVDKAKACTFIGGPIMGIDKAVFSGKADVNTSKGWRAYAVTAAVGGNASNITDRIGPGSGDFKGIDVDLVDCTSTADKDNAQCTKYKKFGFFPGEFGPACVDNVDNDGDGLTDCNDFDCVYDPFFCSGSFTAISDDGSSPSIVWSKINTRVPTALTFIFDTDEPSNGSVKYYYNDTACQTLNTTLLDPSLTDGDAHTDYRPHHAIDLAGLSANTTYFYKFKSCDPSGNCAVSKCSNSTTAAAHTNITFKLDIPASWSVDLPSINLTNYTAGYALKASTQHLQGINITVNDTTTDRAITLVGVNLFEKQTLNISSFLSGTDLLGMDANQFQSFKQKTGATKAVVHIPTDGVDTILEHCDDDGNNCQDVTSKVDCTFSATGTECEVPDAVGLGFSTYKTTSASSSSSSSSSSSGGSSGSGGGGCASGYSLEDGVCVKSAEPSVKGSGSEDTEEETQEDAQDASAQDEDEEQGEREGSGNLAGQASSFDLRQILMDYSGVWLSLVVISIIIILAVYLYRRRD